MAVKVTKAFVQKLAEGGIDFTKVTEGRLRIALMVSEKEIPWYKRIFRQTTNNYSVFTTTSLMAKDENVFLMSENKILKSREVLNLEMDVPIKIGIEMG